MLITFFLFFMYHIKSKIWEDLTKIQTEIDMVTKAELASSTNLVADFKFLSGIATQDIKR